jgi:peptidoglycan/LPS O-acetylase OafA/YrhL
MTSTGPLSTTPTAHRWDAPTTGGAPSATATGTTPKIPFQPGLEGLRGVAVVAVLFFHAGFPWAQGGFLGVSTFFTLSGYLITTLLLHEREHQGRISLRRFWGRRFRRLMPAALLCLAGVVVFGATVADPSQLGRLRGDVIASLAYVANWRFVIDGQSYGALFSSPSPVLHFWSLAIEEQFYVIFPLLVAGVLAVASGSRRVLAAVLGGLTVASVAASLLLYDAADHSRVYYGTYTRAAELLIGALLALALGSSAGTRLLASAGRAWAAGAGVVALVVTPWLWHATKESDAWLYLGGLAAVGLLNALLVVGALVPGPVRQLLSLKPVRWVGAVSYGAYLYHWPIFLWLTSARTGLSAWPLFAIRIAVTFGAAALSYYLVEGPIRRGQRVTGWRPVIIAPVVVSVLVLGLVRVTDDPPGREVSYDIAVGQLTPSLDADQPTSTAAAGDTAGPRRPPAPRRVMTYGDSIAMTLAPGLIEQAEARGDIVFINTAEVSCGTGRGGVIKVLHYVDLPSREVCDARLEVIPSWLEEHRPDEVLVLSCLYDVAARKIPGDDTYRWPGDPVFDAWITEAMHATVQALGAQGARVTWLSCPYMDPADLDNRATGQPERKFEERDPARIDRLNELIREVDRTEPAMRVVDLHAWAEGQPGGSFHESLRGDGVHFNMEGSLKVGAWLAERVFDPLEPAPTTTDQPGSAPPA